MVVTTQLINWNFLCVQYSLCFLVLFFHRHTRACLPSDSLLIYGRGGRLRKGGEGQRRQGENEGGGANASGLAALPFPAFSTKVALGGDRSGDGGERQHWPPVSLHPPPSSSANPCRYHVNAFALAATAGEAPQGESTFHGLLILPPLTYILKQASYRVYICSA